MSLVKIDIEGAEVEVIGGLLDAGLQDKIGVLFAETHEKKTPELEDATNALRRRLDTLRLSHFHLDWH